MAAFGAYLPCLPCMMMTCAVYGCQKLGRRWGCFHDPVVEQPTRMEPMPYELTEIPTILERLREQIGITTAGPTVISQLDTLEKIVGIGQGVGTFTTIAARLSRLRQYVELKGAPAPAPELNIITRIGKLLTCLDIKCEATVPLLCRLDRIDLKIGINTNHLLNINTRLDEIQSQLVGRV